MGKGREGKRGLDVSWVNGISPFTLPLYFIIAIYAKHRRSVKRTG
jgi:hypothetical protein